VEIHNLMAKMALTVNNTSGKKELWTFLNHFSYFLLATWW